MGDRGQVFIKDTGVYLYTHWEARDLVKNVQEAISKKWRWEDVEYLTRIIFDVIVGKEQGNETGFGIGKEERGDIWRLITIDCSNQKIILRDYDKTKEFTFEEFLEVKVK